MGRVTSAVCRWAQNPDIENLLAVYRSVRKVTTFKPDHDLSPVVGMFPDVVGSTTAGDYAGDCIAWAARSVIQYHASVLFRRSNSFAESAARALANAVEAVARSYARGWSETPDDVWQRTQSELADRLPYTAHNGSGGTAVEIKPVEGREDLSELARWADDG
jgi:hypothetical protein